MSPKLPPGIWDTGSPFPAPHALSANSPAIEMPALVAGTKTPQEGNVTATGIPVILVTVPELGNATATSVGDQDSVQSGNRSACGVIAAAGKMTRPSRSWGQETAGGGDRAVTDSCLSPTVVLSAGLAAIFLFVLSRLWARGRLTRLGLLMVVKESLLLSDRKTSLL